MLRRLDAILLYRIRSCVAADGNVAVSRLDDHAVLKQFDQRLNVKQHFRSLPETEIAIEYMTAAFGMHLRLQSYFEHALTFLNFSVPRDAGILYSGQYHLDDDLRRASNRPGTSPLPSSPKVIVDMESLAKLHALRANKTLIDSTPGGRWLLRWNLAFLVGKAGKNEIWSKASLKYVRLLSGEVDVFLAYPMQEAVFRSVEGRALLGNPDVTRVTYFIEHSVGKERPAQEFASQPKFRERFGKELVFKTVGAP